jgi:hypothetical protein
MAKGIVYIVQNPAFPHLVKIGMTEKTSVKDRGLDASNVPEDYEILYAYKCKNPKEIEQYLHEQFDGFRHYSSKGRKTEFFYIGCLQQSLKTLELLRKAGEDVTEEFQETLEEQQEKAKSVDKTKIIDSKNHRDKTLFSEIGIQIGTILTYIYDEKITCKVISDKKVKYKNKEWTISGVAVSLVGYRVSGYKYFKYDGETLWDRRKRLEKEKNV